MKLIIDNREKKFFNLCNGIIEMNEYGFTTELKKLDLGDMIICDDNVNEIIMIERKTPPDLASSITDGRYVEQSFRLSNSTYHNHNIIYLIEGNINQFNDRFHKIKKKALHSAVFTLQYYKGFSVIKTNSMLDSVETILRFMDKLHREKNKKGYYTNLHNCPDSPNSPSTQEDFTNNINNKNKINNKNSVTSMDYASVIKKEKKLNITRENIGVIMLSQIPGVSTLTAKTIMSNFDNFQDFIQAFKSDNIILKNASYTTSNGSKRHISNTSIQNIKKFLF